MAKFVICNILPCFDSFLSVVMVTLAFALLVNFLNNTNWPLRVWRQISRHNSIQTIQNKNISAELVFPVDTDTVVLIEL